jgi:hypothetical protein
MKRLIIIGILLTICISVPCDEGELTTEVTTEATTEATTEVKKEITPEEALNFLSISVTQYQGTWEEHLILRESLRVIAKSLGLYEQSE